MLTVAVNNHIPSVRQTNRRLPCVQLQQVTNLQSVSSNDITLTWDTVSIDDIGIGNCFKLGDTKLFIPSGWAWVRHNFMIANSNGSGVFNAMDFNYMVKNGVQAGYFGNGGGLNSWNMRRMRNGPWLRVKPGDYFEMHYGVNGNVTLGGALWTIEFDT
jgi:hypothetical protein